MTISLQVVNYRRQFLGFTLVELLVVIGIIAVLIAMLLPALSRARQVAQRTSCAAKLQQIMVAANVHRADHKDYYPLAGILTGGQPEELDDPDTQKYDYRNTSPGSGYIQIPTGVNRALAPITVALGSEMGFKSLLNDNYAQAVVDNTGAYGVARCFLCPSQCSSTAEWYALEPSEPLDYILAFSGSAATPAYVYQHLADPSSYIFNEVVVGFNDAYGRLRGHASQVRQPALTMFACDGVGDTGLSPNRSGEAGISISHGLITLYNNFPNAGVALPGSPAITLADIYNSKAVGQTLVGGTASCFDLRRHQGKINIAFCDGHVETDTLPTVTSIPVARQSTDGADLQRVFLMAP
jgi:prepilin-type processing-associated H-X9-DG protein/prepilin-type N-terminal cleavage/methylation domain-containing protein